MSTEAHPVPNAGSHRLRPWLDLVRNPVFVLWKHRYLLYQTVKTDLRARYAGSALGMVWLVLYPLCFLAVYALVYIFIFKIRFAAFNSNEYVALIFCGLIPFLGFSESLGVGVPSVTANAHLIKNTLFPIDLIPVKAVLTSTMTQTMGMVLLLLAVGCLGRLTLWALLLPVVFLAQLAFTVGLIWILSAVNVVLRDLQSIVGVVIIMIMMVTPIAYTVDMVPARIRPLLALNPMYYIVISYQEILMLGRWPTGHVLEIMMALGLCFFCGGYWFFSRAKRILVDDV
jgi:lipopolysaccharide transport system permease protein